MKLLHLPLFAAALLGTASAQEATISVPLLNPGFEDDALSCAPGYYCAENEATGWLCGPISGTFKPSTAEYPNGVPGGSYVAFIGNSGSTGSILQVAPAFIAANTTYGLKLSIGARLDYAFTGYLAALMAGNVTLATDNTLSPAPGTFLTDVITYKSGPNPPLAGKQLQIFVKSFGAGQVNVDDVSLTIIPGN